MSALPEPQQFYSLNDYFALETTDDQRHEYYHGEIFAMSGGSVNHNRISVSVATSFAGALAGKPCEVFVADLRLLVKSRQLYTYPDVMVVCGKLEYAQNRTDLITNPTVIVEVLSPSTENYDRGKKFNFFYRTVETLRDYVLIDQDRILVEHLRRSDERTWLLTVLEELSETLVLESIGVSIPVGEIYQRVDWQL